MPASVRGRTVAWVSGAGRPSPWRGPRLSHRLSDDLLHSGAWRRWLHPFLVLSLCLIAEGLGDTAPTTMDQRVGSALDGAAQ